jgi:hypothetical protein
MQGGRHGGVGAGASEAGIGILFRLQWRKKNRMAGMWSKRLPKKTVFFVRGRRIANGCSLEPRSKQLICVLNFCGGKRKGSLKFEKKKQNV